MDYLKEFQALAGRFSAAAEDKLTSVDGGTYKEFIRFYSQRWPAETDDAAHEEQRQIDILLEELQAAMESPPLLSAPQGTVLHTGAVEMGVGPALSHLCVALEKCLFFGAEGSTPDFWHVLRGAGGGNDHPSVGTDHVGPSSGQRQAAGEVLAAPQGGEKTSDAVTSGDTTENENMVNGADTPGQNDRSVLSARVRRLTRVHTDHGRCRAWARGLLGIDSMAVEEELRRAVEAAVEAAASKQADDDARAHEAAVQTAEGGDGGSEGEKEEATRRSHDSGDRGVVPLTEQSETSQSDPDAGGGFSSSRRVASPVAGDVPHVDKDDGGGEGFCVAVAAASPPFAVLPLWLRPGPQGASIVEEVCRLMREFFVRLDDKSLSIRPSLDHVWLDKENIAAATTYTWPRFPRNKLRCYVRGAGLGAANGEYSPVQTDESDQRDGGSLVLVGPNGCQICRQACAGVDDRVTIPDLQVVDDERTVESGDATIAAADDNRVVPAAALMPSSPFAQRWCLVVPSALAQDGRSRNGYFCLGDGALPPSRGWRATDATNMPAPVLGFATRTEGDLAAGGFHGGGPRRLSGQEETADALFGAAVRVGGDGGEATASTTRVAGGGTTSDSSKTSATCASVVDCAHGSELVGTSLSVSAGETGRRKRRRQPGPVEILTLEDEATDDTAMCGQVNVGEYGGLLKDRYYGTVGRTPGPCSSVTGGVDGAMLGEVGLRTFEQGAEVDGSEAVAAFKAERWTLPAPSGEILLRAERTNELLRQTQENQARMLAVRRSELLEQVAVAKREYQEVLQESMDATKERVLSARSELREQAEAEAARDAQLVVGGGDGRSAQEVPSLEELVAEKAEEYRTRPLSIRNGSAEEEAEPSVPAADRSRNTSRLEGTSPVAAEGVGWPWPIAWLSGPRASRTEAKIQGMKDNVEFGGFMGGEGDQGPDERDGAEVPPFSIEVAAVEAVDMEDPDAAHIEYVLRVIYREARVVHGIPGATTSAEAEGGGRERSSHPTIPKDDPGAAEMLKLATAGRGLVQRTRVLSKRLNSLCALHPQLMWELEEGRRLRPEGGEVMEPLGFPDPFELGTLEESVLRVHRDKLTPRFKANSPTRKLSARISSYLSGLLYFLGVLEATGLSDIGARMSRALNDALSTCDRAGRKRCRGDFVLAVRIEDADGGRLGNWVDEEERLRVQKRSCMGCGRAIAAEFLGMKKDYFPCRFALGLFCRSYCHSEERRIIPHRLVHHWDFTPHRVCKDAAAFLDATRFVPLINLLEECPRLFAEQQPLRLARSRRIQLHLLRRAILLPEERKCVAGARLLEKLLDGRMHLAVDPSLYSVEDLLGVKKGNLLEFLEETVDRLLSHVTDECETCRAFAARLCDACYSRHPIFVFQAEKVARCNGCSSLFHAKCVSRKSQRKAKVASGSPKWRVDATEIGATFVCPRCHAVAALTGLLLD